MATQMQAALTAKGFNYDPRVNAYLYMEVDEKTHTTYIEVARLVGVNVTQYGTDMPLLPLLEEIERALDAQMADGGV